MNPDLIVSHLSCLLDARYAGSDSSLEQHLFDLATFPDSTSERRWVAESEARIPVLRGRLHAFGVPTSPGGATFRDPRTSRLMRERIHEILRLD